MTVSGIDAQVKPMPATQKPGAGSIVGTTISNALMCTGISAGLSHFSKLKEDEFVSIGSCVEGIKDKVKNKKNIEEGLKELFKSEGNEEIIKMAKSAKVKNAAKMGAIYGAAFGGLLGIIDYFTACKRAEKANIIG